MSAAPDQNDAGDQPDLRGSLAEAGSDERLSEDMPRTFGLILRALVAKEQAQGGTLYVYREGKLQFVAAHCTGSNLEEINRELVGRKLEPDRGSLVEFVARTGRTMGFVASDGVSEGTSPFRVDRDFDAITGTKSVTALATRLQCPDGRPVGILKLVNRLGPDGQAVPFDADACEQLDLLASIAAVAIDKSQAQEALRWKHLETILRLSAAAELRGGDMFEHVRRLSKLSMLIAKSLGLSYAETDHIKYASPMHDIGKTRLPDAVVGKAGPLSEEEHRVMRKHTLIGARILRDLGGDVLRTAHDIALAHHERWDGEGYPNGHAGEEIPLTGRIVAVADAFDAMVTQRPHRSPYPIGTALEIVRTEKEKQFDPDVTRAFLQAEDQIREVYRG